MEEAAQIAQAEDLFLIRKRNITARSHRAVPMYPAGRSRDFRLREPLPSIRIFISLTIVFLPLTIRQM